jgi:hypothetical protein
MRAVLGLLALAPFALTMQADTLQLRDGRVINGTYEGGDRAGIRFQASGEDHARLFDLAAVSNITFEGNTAANSWSSSSSYTSRTWHGNGEMPVATTPMPVATSPMPVATNSALYTGPTYSSANIQSPDNRLIPAGTVIAVRTTDPIDCDASQAGATFQVTLAAPVVLNNQMIAPVGSAALVQAMRGHDGKVSLQLISFTNINGQSFNVASSDGVVTGGANGPQSAEVVGGGRVGAEVSAESGYQLMRGHHISVQPATLLSFTLQQSVQV